MLNKSSGVLFGLTLLCGTCFGQTPLHGLVAGKSIRTDVERVAGKPIQVYSQTLVEYHPYEFNSKIWDKNVAKMYVQYRTDSPIIERIELLLGRPVSRADAFKNLNVSTAAARQPHLPDQPAARGKNGDRLVEYFGAPFYIVLTYQGAEAGSGVARSARYSKELFDSAVSSNATSNAPSNTSAGTNMASNNSVTGRWSGSWTNSEGASGQSSIILREQNGMITGEEDAFSMAPSTASVHRNGWTILNGHRSGNVLTWEYRNQYKGCRDYSVRWELSPDGKLANGTYTVTDRCAKQTYTGNYLNYHR